MGPPNQFLLKWPCGWLIQLYVYNGWDQSVHLLQVQKMTQLSWKLALGFLRGSWLWLHLLSLGKYSWLLQKHRLSALGGRPDQAKLKFPLPAAIATRVGATPFSLLKDKSMAQASGRRGFLMKSTGKEWRELPEVRTYLFGHTATATKWTPACNPDSSNLSFNNIRA